MIDAHVCPRCGARLTAEQAREGRCPRCILGLALDAAVEAPDAEAGDGSDGESAGRAGTPDHDPESIGPYRIVRRLGSGGMGVVYLAEQTEPIRREVALKVIRKGLDTTTVMRRFEAERQALALMDHPAIARVLDAGETPEGRPYFVMEYVPGEPVTRYCDRRRLTTRERLDLFAAICDGVQHAHRRGVIHRDLKPSNILVAEEGETPKPKIIDFGIAKAIDRPLTERTLFTGMGVIVGTPEYMSPEQAALSAIEVDTRTDVYSLGVLLYELLVGALPFAAEELRAAGFDEMRRRIREEDPPTPSARLSTLGARSTDTARERQTDAAALRRQIQGDLDWITLKALEKDPGRRYESPADLAADVRRHIADEPVEAGPPDAAYRLRKFVRRHRLPVVFAATLFLLLVGFSVFMIVLYRGSQFNLRRALAAESDADRKATSLEKVSDFLITVFQVSDPGESRGNSVTARELLDGATSRIEADLAGQPEVQSKLLSVLGNVYSSLGLYGEAEKMLRRAVERQRAGDRGPALATALGDLAGVLAAAGGFEEARTLAREALEIQMAVLDPDHPDVATTLQILGAIDWEQGRLEEALASWSRCLEIREQALGPETVEAAQTRNSLGDLFLAQGKHAEAESMFVRALEIRERAQGNDHPEVANALTNLAETYFRQGRFTEAEPLHRRAIAIKEKVLGPDHPDLATSYNNFGVLSRNMGRFEEAEALYRRALAIRQAKLPADHPLIAWTWDNLAYAYLTHGKLAESEDAYEHALIVGKRAGTEGTAEWGGLLNNFALLRVKQKRDPEAEQLHRQALEIWERTLGPDNPRLAFALHNLGVLTARNQRKTEARAYFERALKIREAALGADHKWTQSTREALARLDGRAPS